MTSAPLIAALAQASPLLQLPDPPSVFTLYVSNGATLTVEVDDTGLSWMQRRTDENGIDYYHSGFTVTLLSVEDWPGKSTDLNSDGKVDAFDLSQVLADWGPTP